MRNNNEALNSNGNPETKKSWLAQHIGTAATNFMLSFRKSPLVPENSVPVASPEREAVALEDKARRQEERRLIEQSELPISGLIFSGQVLPVQPSRNTSPNSQYTGGNVIANGSTKPFGTEIQQQPYPGIEIKSAHYPASSARL